VECCLQCREWGFGMDQATLVTDRIIAGQNLLEAMKADGFTVSAAFWQHFPEEDRWRLIVACDHAARTDLLSRILAVGAAIQADRRISAGLKLDDVKLVDTGAHIVSLMARRPLDPALQIVPLEPTVIDGVLIDRTVVYRLAA
jgi:hypothetical protein